MSIRYKIILTLGIISIGIGFLNMGLARRFILPSFLKIETDLAQTNVERVIEAYDNKFEYLSSKISDWANWDDTYNFIIDKNKTYVESDLQDSSLKDLKVDFMIFVDTEGKIIHEKGYDIDNDQPVTNFDGWPEHLKKDGLLTDFQAGVISKQGLVMIDGKPVIFASHAILTSNATGPSRGTLIFGKYLNEQEINKLAGLTKLDVIIDIISQNTDPQDKEITQSLIQTGNPVRVIEFDKNHLNGFSLIKDIYNQPVLLLEVDLSRDIFNRGYAAINYFIAASAVASVIILIITGLLLEFIVIRRIIEFNSNISEIAQKKDFNQKIVVTGNDEISSMSADTNVMLETLKQANYKIEVERQKSQAERDRGEGILRYLHSIAEGIIATDTGGVLTFVNLTAAKMISRAEGSPLIGKKYSKEFLFAAGKEEDEKSLDPVGEALKNPAGFILPKDCRLVSGEKKIPLSGSFAPIVKDGKTLGVVSVFQDITERRNIEKEKDDFLSIAAHQLRTPLTGVRWTIESLLDGDAGKLPKGAKDYLRQILENNQRLITLVNDLLDVSRINMGKLKEEATSVNVCKMLSEATDSLAGLAEEREITVSYEKVCALNPKVRISAKHFFQALENLISNAIKYTPRGGTVKAAADFQKDRVIISVADTGIGIPKKDQDKIFGKFFRASNAVLKETDGSGLGLSMVKSFIEEAGGKVWFESVEGKGTTFFIELPMA